jgi:hypothetical protein
MSPAVPMGARRHQVLAILERFGLDRRPRGQHLAQHPDPVEILALQQQLFLPRAALLDVEPSRAAKRSSPAGNPSAWITAVEVDGDRPLAMEATVIYLYAWVYVSKLLLTHCYCSSLSRGKTARFLAGRELLEGSHEVTHQILQGDKGKHPA